MKAIYALFTIPLLMTALSFSVLAAESPEAASRPSQTEQYAMVVASGKLLSLTKWKVEVDFGQELKIGIKNKDLLRDDNGKTIVFNSPIDALNYLNAQGWTVISATTSDNRFVAIIKRNIQ